MKSTAMPTMTFAAWKRQEIGKTRVYVTLDRKHRYVGKVCAVVRWHKYQHYVTEYLDNNYMLTVYIPAYVK